MVWKRGKGTCWNGCLSGQENESFSKSSLIGFYLIFIGRSIVTLPLLALEETGNGTGYRRKEVGGRLDEASEPKGLTSGQLFYGSIKFYNCSIIDQIIKCLLIM